MKRNRKLVLILALITAAVYYLLPSVEFYSMTDDGLEAMGLKAPEQTHRPGCVRGRGRHPPRPRGQD